MTNETHVQYHSTVTTLFERYTPATLGIEAAYAPYQQSFKTEESLLDQVQASGITPEIMAQDTVRDDLYRGFSAAVKSYLKHFDAKKRTAAEKLAIILKSYGNIATKGFDRETAALVC